MIKSQTFQFSKQSRTPLKKKGKEEEREKMVMEWEERLKARDEAVEIE